MRITTTSKSTKHANPTLKTESFLKLIGRINQSQCTFPRFVIGLVPLLLLPTPTIWVSLDHKRNVSGIGTRCFHKIISSTLLITTPTPSPVKTLKTGLYRLHLPVSPQLAQGFRANFSRCAFLSCSLELAKSTVKL